MAQHTSRVIDELPYVPSTFDINEYSIRLDEKNVVIEHQPSWGIVGRPAHVINLEPKNRDEAIRLSIVLRKAARRLEAIGNTVLGNGGK